MSALLVKPSVAPPLDEQIAEAEARIYIAERRSDPYMRQREIERWTRHLNHLEDQRRAL